MIFELLNNCTYCGKWFQSRIVAAQPPFSAYAIFLKFRPPRSDCKPRHPLSNPGRSHETVEMCLGLPGIPNSIFVPDRFAKAFIIDLVFFDGNSNLGNIGNSFHKQQTQLEQMNDIFDPQDRQQEWKSGSVGLSTVHQKTTPKLNIMRYKNHADPTITTIYTDGSDIEGKISGSIYN